MLGVYVMYNEQVSSLIAKSISSSFKILTREASPIERKLALKMIESRIWLNSKFIESSPSISKSMINQQDGYTISEIALDSFVYTLYEYLLKADFGVRTLNNFVQLVRNKSTNMSDLTQYLSNSGIIENRNYYDSGKGAKYVVKDPTIVKGGNIVIEEDSDVECFLRELFGYVFEQLINFGSGETEVNFEFSSEHFSVDIRKLPNVILESRSPSLAYTGYALDCFLEVFKHHLFTNEKTHELASPPRYMGYHGSRIAVVNYYIKIPFDTLFRAPVQLPPSLNRIKMLNELKTYLNRKDSDINEEEILSMFK
jgi:hypothetical protein